MLQGLPLYINLRGRGGVHLAGAVITLTTAFLVNLPLGRWRSKCRKFSRSWFLAVHLSIPLIFWMRTFFGLGVSFIPLTIVCALLGQLLGGRVFFIITSYRKRGKMS